MLTISVAVHSATLSRPLARAIASLLNLFFPGGRPPALLLLADGADGSNRLAELLSTMLPAGTSIEAPGGRRESLSDGTSEVPDVPEDRMWVRYVAGWSPRPDVQMPAARRIASYFPDEDGPGEDLYQEADEDGDPEADSQDVPVLEPRQPSAAVVLADDQGRRYPLTPFAVRRWVADNGVDLPESGVFAEQLVDVLYPDEPAEPRVYQVDEAAAFVQHVRDRLRDDLQLGQDLVLEAVREASRWIGRRFRPGQYVYVGLGSGPAAIIAALRQLNPDVQTANMPLTDFLPGPAEHGSILAAFLDGLPASSEQLARLHRHFEEFLGGLPADRPILLIDYIPLGQPHSLVSAQHHLQWYLEGIGRSQVVHALAIYDATGESMSGAEAIGIPVDGEPAGTVAARRQWASRFGVLPLGEDGPLGELLSEALADALAYRGFDGTAEYGPYRVLAQSARSFEEGRPRRGPDARPAYGVLSEAVAGQVRLGSGLGEAMEPEPGQPGIADLGVAGRYLRASQVELPASVSSAEARGWLAAVVAGAAVASHPAGASEVPGNGGEVGRALLLLGGLAEPAYYFNARLGGAGLDLYQPGAVVTAADLTVGLVDQPGLSEGENARFVVLPLAGRSGRYASRGRDAGLLLGTGAAVFPPGTSFVVYAREDADGGDGSWSTTIVLEESAAAGPGPVRLEDVLPVTGPGVLGLNKSVHRYLYLLAVRAAVDVWSALAPAERQAQGQALMRTLLAAANERLEAIGVPAVALDAEGESSTLAMFFYESWDMEISIVPGNRDEALRVASMIWHEARHAEQAFLALRYLAGGPPDLPALEATQDIAPHVLLRATEHVPAAGSAAHVAGEHWAAEYFEPGAAETYRQVSSDLDALAEAVDGRVQDFRQAESAGAGQAELDELSKAHLAASQKLTQDGFRPYVSRPREWDAYYTQDLLGPVTKTAAPGPPGAGGRQQVFSHMVQTKQDQIARLWLGVAPGTAADLLVSPLRVPVVHGRGMDGRLRVGGVVVDTGWLGRQLEELADGSQEVVLLASDSERTAQELADARGTRVWGPPPRGAGVVRPAEVWASLGTGAVAVGAGSLTAEGRLEITPGALHCYQPRDPAGGAGPLGAVPQDEVGLAPVRVLTAEQALADPGPWQRRAAWVSAGPLDWEGHVTSDGRQVSVGRDGRVIRQVLMLTPAENISAFARAAGEKMVLPDEVAVAVHVPGVPGRGPELAAGDLAAVLAGLGVPRRPVWLVSSGAADGGRGSYAQQFAEAWGQPVIAGREQVWVRFDGVVASSRPSGPAGLRPLDLADGQHQKFLPELAAPPRDLGPVLPPVPGGAVLGDGPWQSRTEAVVPSLPNLPGGAGAGGLDVDAFDQAWANLDGEELGREKLLDATELARELMRGAGRGALETEAMSDVPISDLGPQGQAVRWLAAQVSDNLFFLGGNDPQPVLAGRERFEAMARVLAARLAAAQPAALPGPAEVAPAPSGEASGGTLDQRSDLIARVRANLDGLGWPGDLADDEIIGVYERLKDDPAAGRGTAALANSIALSVAGGSLGPMRGGGSGIEAEFTHLMTISGHDLDELLADRAVLAYGPGRMFAVTVDEVVCFLGGDGRYYRTRAGAESAPGGTAREVIFAMPEFVSNVTRTFPAEFGYARHEPVFAALSRLERILAGLRGEEGSPPGIPLSEVLRPEDGFELTELGQRTLIGPRPAGDRPGANIQYTFGVPLTGLYPFLEHVLDNTRPDEKKYLRRAHLADGLEFGTQVALRFMMETYFPDGSLPPGLSAEGELARRSASEPDVAQLRGYAALLYTGAATVAHSHIYRSLNKDNAAVLARHDMEQILAALPPEVRDYLTRNAADVMSRFERSFRNRIPDYDDRFRDRWFGAEEGGGPVTIDLLRPPLDWQLVHPLGLPVSPANYLLGGLDPAAAPQILQDLWMIMTTVPGLDAEHQEELGFELVVLEVRAYGARPVRAAVARVNHERLAVVVRELGVRDQEIALAASARGVIGEGLARDPATLRLREAAPRVMRQARPGVIWAAALGFLRADPAAVSRIGFVEDAWRQDGGPWTLIPLPAGIRELLGVGGPTVIRGAGRAGRAAHASPGQVPEPVAVIFPEGRSGEEDVPDSLELTALARWLAEAGAAHDPGTRHGGQLPQVQITGFGNGRHLDRTDESARRTGQRRAGVVRARLLASVREHLRQLGADPAIADSLLPAGLATGAPRPAGVTRAEGRQAVATVRASSSQPADLPAAVEEAPGTAFEAAPAWEVVPTPSGFYFPGPEGDEDSLAAALSFPPVDGATVLHLHTDPVTGSLVAGDRVLAPEEFFAEFGSRLGLVPGRLLVLVACGAAVPRAGAGRSAAARLGEVAGVPVLAAGADVSTLADGSVRAVRYGVDERGVPVASGGSWMLSRPGGALAEFGPDLLDTVRGGQLEALLGLPAGAFRVHPDSEGAPAIADRVNWMLRGGDENTDSDENTDEDYADEDYADEDYADEAYADEAYADDDEGWGAAGDPSEVEWTRVTLDGISAWRSVIGLSFVDPGGSLLRQVTRGRDDLVYLEVRLGADGSEFELENEDGSVARLGPEDLAGLVALADQGRTAASRGDTQLVSPHREDADRGYEAAFGTAAQALATALGTPVHVNGYDSMLVSAEIGTAPQLRAAARPGPGHITETGTVPEIRTLVPAPGRGARTEPRLRSDGAGGLVPAGGLADNGAGSVLAPVTREHADRMQAIYAAVRPVSGVLDIDLEVRAGGSVAAVYQDGTLTRLTPREFARWLAGTGRFTGQDLRLLAPAPAGAGRRARFAWSLGEFARSAGTNIYWAGGNLELDRDGELTARAEGRQEGWSVATFDGLSNPSSGWFASQACARPCSARAGVDQAPGRFRLGQLRHAHQAAPVAAGPSAHRGRVRPGAGGGNPRAVRLLDRPHGAPLPGSRYRRAAAGLGRG